MSSHKFFLAIAFVIIASFIAASVVIDRQNNLTARFAQQEDTRHHLDDWRAHIETAIDQNTLPLVGLRAVLMDKPHLSQDEFAHFVAPLFADNPYLINVAFAPDLIVTRVYPYQSNRTAIGLDYRKMAEQRELIFAARDEKQVRVAGPVALVQGGHGVIVRMPIFGFSKDQQSVDTETFIGMLSAVIDADALFAVLDSNAPQTPHHIAMRGKDGKGKHGEVFYGPSDLFDPMSDAVSVDIEFLGGQWQIAARPIAGWLTVAPNALFLRAILVVICITLMALTALITQLLIRKRATEIRLRSLFEMAPVGIALNDFTTGEFVDANSALLQQTGYDKQEFQKLSYFDITPIEYQVAETEQLEQLKQTGHFGPYEKHYIKKSGERYEVLLQGVKVIDSDGRELIWSIIEDISERKAQQQLLQEHQQQLELIIENTGVGIWDWHIPSGKVQFNERWASMLGYSLAELAPTTIDTFKSLCHPDDVAKALTMLSDYWLRTIDSYELVLRMQHQAGHWVWVYASGKVVEWQDEFTPTRMVGSHLDISNQKITEQYIAEQQTMLEAMSEQGRIGAWQYDVATNQMQWSTMSQRLFAVDASFQPDLNKIQRFCVDIKDAQLFQQAFNRCLTEGDAFEIQLLVRNRVDQQLWLEVAGEAKYDGEKISQVFGTFRDVNERMMADFEIQARQQQLAKQVALIQCIANAQSRFIEQAEQQSAFDFLLHDLLDLTDSAYGFIAEILTDDDSGALYLKTKAITNIAWDAKSQQLYDQHYRTGLEFRNLDTLFGAALKTLQPVLSNDPVNDPRASGTPGGHPPLTAFLGIPILRNHKPVAMIGLANREDGYQPSLIDWLSPFSHTIGQIIVGLQQEQERQRTQRELLVAKELAESASQARTEFLATMSHEIRTPLNGVIGMLSLLQNSDLNLEQQHKTRIAASSAESLLSLINDILDFSKVDAGRLDLEIIEFNLRDVLSEVVEAQAIRAEEKQLELVLNQSAVQHNLLQGDPYRLRQILNNLIGNAIKFTDSGEIVVECRLDEQPRGLHLTVSICDSGVGIDASKREQLFKVFNQLDASTTRKYGGTGLGLAICKKLCQLMDGDVFYSANFPRGSRFTFNLWLQASHTPSIYQPLPENFQYRLLVVDDNQASRDSLQQQLTACGIEVHCEASATEALIYLQNTLPLPNGVLIDHVMPVQDGFSLAATIHKNPVWSSISLLLMSNQTNPGDARSSEQLGFSGYFPKPINIDELCAAMQLLKNKGQLPLPELLTRHNIKSWQDEQEPVLNNGHRLLLVEDNKVNQEVARLLLQDMGYTVDIASNGQEALSQLQRFHQYPLILMDCQMPIMDGYQTSQNIRLGAAGDHYRSIPIIALTANAMKGDKDRCLAAGMNDYLSKPLAADILRSKLHLWLEQPSQPQHETGEGDAIEASAIESSAIKANAIKTNSSEASASTADTPPDSQQLGSEPQSASAAGAQPQATEVDEQLIWDEIGLLAYFNQNQAVVSQLLGIFVKFAAQKRDELQTLSPQHFAELVQISHATRGSAGQLKAKQLEDIALRLERAAKEQNAAETESSLPLFTEALSRLEHRFKRYLHSAAA